jgi:hypothetical protein
MYPERGLRSRQRVLVLLKADHEAS